MDGVFLTGENFTSKEILLWRWHIRNQRIPNVMDWVFVSPKILVLKSYCLICPKEVGLWEVIRIRWNHKGRVLMKGISALTSTRGLATSALLLATWGYNSRLLSAVWRRVPTRTQLCWHPDIGLPASRTVRSQFLLFISLPFCDILLQQPELRHSLM